ncbi:hypothetical protein KSS87_011307 [Heliosperma pusillum]|nr:hypothetical protein KSS87_011307 [Heliosperma pusillum]
MGVGRKMETVVPQKNFNHQSTCNINPHSARHLRKNELAGVIFGCTHSTFKECTFKQLFASHIQYVQNVTPGMPLFLFNYSDRTLHGLFEATSSGQININKYAWTLDGQATTPFPAQVRVKIRMQCRPLREDQYKPILAKNYLEHEPNHLWFELDPVQTNKLISLFSTSPVSPSVSLPPTAARWGTLFRQSAAPVAHEEECNPKATNIVTDQLFVCESMPTLKGEERSDALLDRDVAKGSENGIVSDSERKWSSLFKPQFTLSSSKECEESNSEGPPALSDNESPTFSGAISVNGAPPMAAEMTNVAEALTLISDAPYSGEDTSSEGNSDLRAVVIKLIQDIGEMKELHIRQTMKIHNLELELKEASRKLQKSESHHEESAHSGSSLSSTHLDEMIFENQDIYQSILLVGGFDGSSWLQNIDCYCPFEDVMRPLAHMKTVRSYSSAVKRDGNLYVLGGECDSSWYDTVESYNLQSLQWASYPSLNRKKGSLAAVSLLAKIFAIGGGDAEDSLSEVEVFDLNVGKWIVTRSMLQKRFAPAAAELNGVLYVAGGYDGQEYVRRPTDAPSGDLKPGEHNSSVERFDPRVYSWTRLKSMNSSRGCHSLTVLNEKLYAIGGYDGTQMVPTVEMFEPRTGSWTMSKPMTYARGGLSGITFGERIYVIGGMQSSNDVLDTVNIFVECYTEGEGWKLMESKTIGKRCFCSAVVV